YITHDSDSTPSLANRIIAPMASIHAVALDPSIYPYPQGKTVKVGVPISSNYSPVNEKGKEQFKTELGLSNFSKVICVTGGGNGADKLNSLVIENVPFLLKRYPGLAIIHIAGRSFSESLSENYDQLLEPKDRKRVIVKGFITDLHRYSGAADVIIARGGATNLAEFAAQGKACIIIPSTQLIWNVRNAQALAKEHAVIELSEEQAEQELRLANKVADLFDHPGSREELKKKLVQFYVPDSAQKIADLILKQANPKEL
ncbi:MAG: UDP-N-acetylglucosamine--N-acetylmuramyl-(pentapeptide) pyrophosphoryl-undecaprenol N-acetylglucosamine transferase, partial [Candidatus Saccharimonadales bacterium]